MCRRAAGVQSRHPAPNGRGATRQAGRTLLATLVFALSSRAQTPPPSSTATSWKNVGGTTLNVGLAGRASGPVRAAWYAPGTDDLLAETQWGRVFETSDGVHWRFNTSATAPEKTPTTNYPSLRGATTAVQSAGSRLYASGTSNVFASDDAGRSWVNLTAFNDRSIIGGGFTSLAVSPSSPAEVSVSNNFGVWRSLDGGLSWTGLNGDLPNLSVRKLIDRRTALLADGTTIVPGDGGWRITTDVDPEAALQQEFSSIFDASITAAATRGSVAYAGTADGRLLSSHDAGASWEEAPKIGSAPITRIWTDAEQPDIALAAAGTRLYRTVNGGLFWDDVSGTLQGGQIHGVAADRSAGVIYTATDRGLFTANISLNDAGTVSPSWRSSRQGLPIAPVWDVRLNPDNTLTVAMDGYGVFEAAAPHQTRNVRIVSGADLTDRPAAPGSLISILGAKVTTARQNGADSQQAAWPVIASSDQSSQLQVPFEIAPGTVALTVDGARDHWSLPLTVKNAAPAIFVDDEGAPLIIDAVSGLAMDPNIAVRAGSTVQLLTTGLGKVKPEWPTGVPAPADSPPIVVGAIDAFLDGRPIEVLRATLAPSYVGYYLVELQIPAIVNRGASELRLSMNGTGSNAVKLFLEPASAPQ